MPEDSRPAKPAINDEVELAKGGGPVKGSRSTSRRTIRGKTVRKPTVDASRGAAARLDRPKELPDQEGRRPRTSDTYVRLRIRVEDGDLRVVDSQVVQGSLEQTTFFGGPYAYEVNLDGVRLHAGALPDLGVMRAFVPPGKEGEHLGHNFQELTTYGFDVRVPSTDLTTAALRRLQVRLFRVKAQPDHEIDSVESLERHLEANMREVGEVTGVPRSALPVEFRPAASTTAKSRSVARPS
jgi:hypothetical protein